MYKHLLFQALQKELEKSREIPIEFFNIKPSNTIFNYLNNFKRIPNKTYVMYHLIHKIEIMCVLERQFENFRTMNQNNAAARNKNQVSFVSFYHN